jgi:hypothetical protein
MQRTFRQSSNFAKEAKITLEIRKLLAKNGIWHFKHWSGVMGKSGVSDIIGCLPPDGRLLCIEVKRPGGKLSKEQAQFLEDVNEAGGLAFVAYSTRDVIEKLNLPDLFLNE